MEQPDRPTVATSLDFDAQFSIQYSFILKKEAALIRNVGRYLSDYTASHPETVIPKEDEMGATCGMHARYEKYI